MIRIFQANNLWTNKTFLLKWGTSLFWDYIKGFIVMAIPSNEWTLYSVHDKDRT